MLILSSYLWIAYAFYLISWSESYIHKRCLNIFQRIKNTNFLIKTYKVPCEMTWHECNSEKTVGIKLIKEKGCNAYIIGIHETNKTRYLGNKQNVSLNSARVSFPVLGKRPLQIRIRIISSSLIFSISDLKLQTNSSRNIFGLLWTICYTASIVTLVCYIYV